MSVPLNKDGQPKALELDVPKNLDEWVLDDMELFEPGGFSVKGFKGFMASYSNWTPVEVGRLTVAEMKTVLPQIAAKLNLAAVPKETGASS